MANKVTDKDKRIMTACGKMLPLLSEGEKDRFLNFTEGMAFLGARRVRTADTAPQQTQT